MAIENWNFTNRWRVIGENFLDKMTEVVSVVERKCGWKCESCQPTGYSSRIVYFIFNLLYYFPYLVESAISHRTDVILIFYTVSSSAVTWQWYNRRKPFLNCDIFCEYVRQCSHQKWWKSPHTLWQFGANWNGRYLHAKFGLMLRE